MFGRQFPEASRRLFGDQQSRCQRAVELFCQRLVHRAARQYGDRLAYPLLGRRGLGGEDQQTCRA